MNFTRYCTFVLGLFILDIYTTQSFDFGAICSNDNLSVTYGSLSVDCGGKFDRESVTPAPKITFSGALEGKFYEVLMIDPDAPSKENPVSRSWLHMLLSDVKGSDLKNGISPSDSGFKVTTGYAPPTPPTGSGYHRYILMVFRHDKPLGAQIVIPQRGRFDIDKFTAAYGLPKTPDASNMFETFTD